MDVPFTGLGLLLQHMIGSFGATATLQAGSAYLQTHVGGSCQGKTATIQVGKPDAGGTVRPFTYPGSKCTDWALTAELNKFLLLNVQWDAWQELTPDNPQGTSAGPALASASYTSGLQFFHFVQGAIYNGGTLSTAAGVTTLTSPVLAARVMKAEVKCQNPLDTTRYFLAGQGGPGAFAYTATSASPCVFTATGSALTNGTPVQLLGGSAPTGFTNGTTYYVVAAAGATFELAATPGGTAINSTSTGNGTVEGAAGVAGVKNEQLENNFRKLGGQLDVEFFNLGSYYDTYAGDTTSTLELIFTGPVISTIYPYMFSVLIPNIRYDGQSPPVPGPGVLRMQMPFTGLDDEADNVVQFQYQSTDSAV
jgi:hypothetical protein